MQITKTMIIDKEKWDIETIKDRTTWLINELLNKIIPIPEDKRKSNNFSHYNLNNHSFSFRKLNIIGETIYFIKDERFSAKIVSDKEVEFENKRYKLSPLTRLLMNRIGEGNKSGAYQGSVFWQYDGKRLLDLMEEFYRKEEIKNEI